LGQVVRSAFPSSLKRLGTKKGRHTAMKTPPLGQSRPRSPCTSNVLRRASPVRRSFLPPPKLSKGVVNPSLLPEVLGEGPRYRAKSLPGENFHKAPLNVSWIGKSILVSFTCQTIQAAAIASRPAHLGGYGFRPGHSPYGYHPGYDSDRAPASKLKKKLPLRSPVMSPPAAAQRPSNQIFPQRTMRARVVGLARNFSIFSFLFKEKKREKKCPTRALQDRRAFLPRDMATVIHRLLPISRQ